VSGILQSQNLRGPKPTEFKISQLAPDGAELGGLYLLPGGTQVTALPFVTEIGPWRRLFAAMQATFGDSGFVALSYEVEQGLDTPPATFGTRNIGTDLLPLVSPNFLVPRGDDLDRPRFGWFTQGSLERADSASARFSGDHNCAGQCSDLGTPCAVDGDCSQGGVCNINQCDELEWRVAWRPWNADTTLQVPTVPTGLSPIAYWSPSGQSKFGLTNIAWMDLDFITGWDEAKALGQAVFPFSDGDFLNDVLPEETTLLLTFLGDK